jgi:hypothetical protein
MSTIKTDTIVAVSTNGDLSLDGLGTGGVSIASTLKMTKGGDIASASPLVIDVDGNYFDVTGTTNFSAMTVESGNFFMLQFDGALTITHGSGIELPGAANLTTATGDRLMCYATAANTVEVMSVETEAAAAAGGLVLQVIGVTVAEATGSTNIPTDDTPPLITEGDQIATQAITLADDSNKVLITGAISAGNGTTGVRLVVTVFRDSTLVTTRGFSAEHNNRGAPITISFLDSPATASEITYTFRMGADSGTWYTGAIDSAGGTDYGDTIDDNLILMEISA